MTFPLAFSDGNLLFGNPDGVGALYRLEPVSYPFLASVDKIDWYKRVATAAMEMRGDFSLYRVNRAYRVEDYVDEAMEMRDHHAPLGPLRAYLEGQREHIAGLRPTVPEIYLLAHLRLGADASHVTRKALRATARWRKPRGYTQRDLEDLRSQEEQLRDRLGASLPCRRATTGEVQWLMARVALRGLREPQIDPHWRPSAQLANGVLRPLGRDMIRLHNEPVRSKDRHVEIDTEWGTSRQTALTVGALPEQSVFPSGAELLFMPLESVGFPVDAAVHVQWISNRDALQKARRGVVDADNAYVEEMRSEHGSLSFVTEENRTLARELDAQLQGAHRPPLLSAALSLVIDDDGLGPEELDRRVEQLRHEFGGVTLHRPLGLQRQLFADHLLRLDTGTVREYADLLTVDQFAALMPIGTHVCGDNRGPLFARTTTYGNRPVRENLRRAPLASRPPSWLLTGTLGSGKTIAAELLAFQAIMAGSVGVDIDPKGDHYLKDLPELKGKVNVLELSGDSRYAGMLDPLVIGQDDLREDLAHTTLTDLLPAIPGTWDTQLLKAIKATLLMPDPSCMRVVDWLLRQPGEDAKAVGEALAARADSGLAQLVFSNGQASEWDRYPLTTIRPLGLTLPKDEPRNQTERMSVAILRLVASLAMRIMTSHSRDVHKVLLADEAWFLLGTAEGRQLLDRLNYFGRTWNATLLLVTQLVGAVGPIEDLIGTRVSFGQETRAGARAVLELHGLNPDDRRAVDRQRGYRKGRALMTDIDDRSAEIQVEVVYPHILEVLDTSPRSPKAALAATEFEVSA